MKKLIIILILCIYISNAQNKEPSAYKFEWGSFTNDTTLLLDSFNVNRFKLGFQWGGSSQMSNALYHNIVHGGSFDSDDIDSNYSEEMYVIGQVGTQIKDMSMIQYEPTLQTDDYRNFNPRPYDKANSIFGFNNIHGTILDSSMSGNANYNRLILYQDSMSSYPANKIVLSDITPKDQFETFDKTGGQMLNYDGTGWNVSINVRRLDLEDDELSDDPVLVIKLPYMARDTNGTQRNSYIRFDYAPDVNKNVLHLNYLENRGIAVDTSWYDHMANENWLDSIVITKRMLSIDNNPRDWTISAHFTCYQKEEFDYYKHYNPRFKPGIAGEQELIEEIDIEVKYYGNCDIAIDWVRIENDKAQQVLRGQYDASARADVSTFVNQVLSEEKNGSKVYKIHRLYNQDTESSNPTWWGQARYWNLVTNGVTITRDGLSAPESYRYYTKTPNRWIGFGLGNDDFLTPAPYIRRGKQQPETMNLKYGFLKHYNDIKFPDSLASAYEMKIDTDKTFSDFSVDSTYLNFIRGSDVLQARYEETINDSYFDTVKNNFLFNGDEWYFYNRISDMNYNNGFLTTASERIETFEEFSLQYFHALIMGCRGFISDGDNNEKLPNINAGNMGVGDYTKLDGSNDIYSNLVGDDFINEEFDTWNAFDYVDLGLLSQEMEVDSNRIYIGTKSMRDGLFQLNTFIRATESDLLKLHLAAAMSKGYRTLYTQNEDIYGTDTLLNKFLNFDTTKSYTKRMYKKRFFDTTYTESYDSAFFNITILKEDDVPLDSVFYIGVQNRRTDPLIYWNNQLPQSERHMRFLSSAEFRDSCINSPDSLIYQEYWWKRLGAREITIPFNYTYSDTNDYKLLKISEIGSDVDSLNALWHRGEKYYDMVTDTVIGQDRSLAFRLLPGQVKILKVEVLKSDVVEGYLDDYNQTKMISYPYFLDSNFNVFHLTYYKTVYNPDSSFTYDAVHYIKSLPTAKNSQQENIKWDYGSNRNISEIYLDSETDTVKYNDCNHPAIVVREDSLGFQKAYIVYTCDEYEDVGARVVEAVVDVMSSSILSNNAIYNLSSNDIEQYGIPVINANAKGNFIAFADKGIGLIAKFQYPDEIIPHASDTIKLNDFKPTCGEYDILYPSMNTYSKINNGENNAGIVWYQYCESSKGGVFYSRLFYNDTTNKVEFMIPNIYRGDYILQHDPQLRFTNLYPDMLDTVRPIIYRFLGNYNLAGSEYCKFDRMDYVHWVMKRQLLPQPVGIRTMTISLKDSNNIPYAWKATPFGTYQFTGDLESANITGINTAQPTGYVTNGNSFYPTGVYNLNVTIDEAETYQVPSYEYSIIRDENDIIDGDRNSFSFAANGVISHLAKSPTENLSSTGEIRKNRRVMQTDEEGELNNPIIRTSAKLFFKQSDQNYESEGFFGFKGGINDASFSVVKDELASNEMNQFEDEWIRFTDCNYLNVNEPDTILTEFNSLIGLAGSHNISMSFTGIRDTNIKVFIQRLPDSALAELPLPYATAINQDKKLFYTIIDSTNDDFRIMYVANDTNSFYYEKAFIGGITHQDSTYYKSNGDKYHYIIDFNNGTNYKANETSKLQLVVYPNPTNGKVQVQSILPEGVKQYKNSHRNITVGVYSTTGKLLYEKIGITGQIIEFDMSSSPTGSYIINASYEDDINKLKGMEKLIKE